jgi:pimeloyl-ACP methyl ester carboxylesterase
MVNKIHSVYILFLLYITTTCANLDEASDYFNTSFLIHYDQVTAALIKDGFNEIDFYAEDGLKLNGLFLQRPNATCNTILCCGFYPGRKEGLAAFYHLLPQNSNIFLFDARGHGKSDGRFLSKIPFYGLHEYNDIIGAATYLSKQNNKPTIILGVCAGAYHAVRAIDKLQKNNDLIEKLNIKGLILDSSIISLLESTRVPKEYFKHAILPGLLRTSFYPNQKRHEIKKTSFYRLCWTCAAPLLTLFEYFLWPCVILRNEAIDIRPLCARIDMPIFFIHAQNDAYVSFELAQSCAEYASKYWWPEQSEHACIYLKHKHAYRDHLHDFFATVLHA